MQIADKRQTGPGTPHCYAMDRKRLPIFGADFWLRAVDHFHHCATTALAAQKQGFLPFGGKELNSTTDSRAGNGFCPFHRMRISVGATALLIPGVREAMRPLRCSTESDVEYRKVLLSGTRAPCWVSI